VTQSFARNILAFVRETKAEWKIKDWRLWNEKSEFHSEKQKFYSGVQNSKIQNIRGIKFFIVNTDYWRLPIRRHQYN
jgi:hypothetical protein